MGLGELDAGSAAISTSVAVDNSRHHTNTHADRRDKLEAVEVEKNILINMGRRNQLGVLNVM